MKKQIVIIVLCFILTHLSSAQNIAYAEIQKNSILTVDGSTNIITYKLYQNGDKLSKSKLKVVTTNSQNKIILNQNQLTVAVGNFASNNFIALKEFLKLVKSDSYPTLQVQMNFNDGILLSDKTQSYNGNAQINITITGITKQYNIPVSLKSNGDMLILDGNKKLNIHDFGLNPKPKMMGLMKINEWIDINFHIIYKIKADTDIAKH